MNTVFITFIYPQAILYFRPFLNSLLKQTDLEFKLIIFNDGCKQEQLEIFLNQEVIQVEIINNKCNSIAVNRLRAFKILSRYSVSNFIFGDVDDTFASNRIEVSKYALKKNPIVFNELNLNNTRDEVLEDRLILNYLKDREYVNGEMVKEHNLIGFSHLALNKEAIKIAGSIKIANDIQIVDWVVISNLLNHYQAYFEKNTYTNYIFHDNNIALTQQGSLNQYIFYLEVKIKNYSQLLHLDYWYKKEMLVLIELKKVIENNREVQTRFIDYINKKQIIHYPWWSQIKNSKELLNELQF